MGYYTRYKLDIFPVKERQKVVDWLKETADFCLYGNEWLVCLIEDPFNSDLTKWYNHDKDMRELSKHFSELLFVLSGKGEEPGDIWIAYYKNGKAQIEQAKIQIDPFNPDLLE